MLLSDEVLLRQSAPVRRPRESSPRSQSKRVEHRIRDAKAQTEPGETQEESRQDNAVDYEGVDAASESGSVSPVAEEWPMLEPTEESHAIEYDRNKLIADANGDDNTTESSTIGIEPVSGNPEPSPSKYPVYSWLSWFPDGSTLSQRLRIIRKIKSVFRPQVRTGYRRLEWTCSCSRAMYGDYVGSNTMTLEERLQRLAKDDPRTGLSILSPGFVQSTCSFGSIQNHAQTTEHSSFSLGAGSTSCGTSHLRRPSESRSRKSMASSDSNPQLSQTSSSSSISRPSHGTVPRQSFLGICVNRSKHLVSLGEITLVDAEGNRSVQSDFELFGTFAAFLPNSLDSHQLNKPNVQRT